MNQLRSQQYYNFNTAAIITLVFAAVIAGFIIYYGKTDSFVFINSRHNAFFDFVFKYYTHLGDGMMWVPLGLYCIFLKKDFIVSVVTAIIISTVLTHLLKRVIFPDELRPFSLLTQNIYVHIIEGIKINRMYSFPSGHTATAFTMALLLVFIMNKKHWSIILPLLAFGVAYSRVYLAQHFVVDVMVGMFIGLISAFFSLLLSKKIRLTGNNS